MSSVYPLSPRTQRNVQEADTSGDPEWKAASQQLLTNPGPDIAAAKDTFERVSKERRACLEQRARQKEIADLAKLRQVTAASLLETAYKRADFDFCDAVVKGDVPKLEAAASILVTMGRRPDFRGWGGPHNALMLTALDPAAYGRALDAVRQLYSIHQLYTVHSSNSLLDSRFSQRTPLGMAIEHGDPARVQALLNRGASLHDTCYAEGSWFPWKSISEKYGPLEMAWQRDDPAILNLLLEPLERWRDSMSGFAYAFQKHSFDRKSLLRQAIESRASVACLDVLADRYGGKDAIELALTHGRPDLVKHFIDRRMPLPESLDSVAKVVAAFGRFTRNPEKHGEALAMVANALFAGASAAEIEQLRRFQTMVETKVSDDPLIRAFIGGLTRPIRDALRA